MRTWQRVVFLAAIATAALLGSVPASRAQDREGGPVESAPIAKTPEEKKILDVLDDMDRNQRQGMMNVPKEDGRLLRLFTEATGARHVVEIGTSNGYSAIWFCLALRTTGGHLTTFEIDEGRAALARKNFQRAGVEELVTLILGNAHEKVADLEKSIDILFLDADKEGYVDYLDKLLPLVRRGGLVIAHNMHRPAPYPEFIRVFTTNADLETIFLNMHAAGIGVALKKRG